MPTHTSQSTRARSSSLSISMPHKRNGKFLNKRKIADDIWEIARREKEELTLNGSFTFLYFWLRHFHFPTHKNLPFDEIGNESRWAQQTNQLIENLWLDSLCLTHWRRESLVEIFEKTTSSVTFCRLGDVSFFVPSIKFIYCRQNLRNFPLVWQSGFQPNSIFITRNRK